MDLKMPGLDEVSEATRRLRRREAESGSPRTPIVALTANMLEETRSSGKSAGFDADLAKPSIRAISPAKSIACAACGRRRPPGSASVIKPSAPHACLARGLIHGDGRGGAESGEYAFRFFFFCCSWLGWSC